jgi:hypothetical protein
VLPAEEGLPGPASRRVDEATRDRGLNLVQERAENLEHDRDALLESMAAKVPEDLDGLTGDQRNKVYRMLGLVITPAAEGLEVTAALNGVLYGLRDGEEAEGCEVEDAVGSRGGGSGYLARDDRAYEELVAALRSQIPRVHDHLPSPSRREASAQAI